MNEEAKNESRILARDLAVELTREQIGDVSGGAGGPSGYNNDSSHPLGDHYIK